LALQGSLLEKTFGQNVDAIAKRINILRCPSDATKEEALMDRQNLEGVLVAVTNYKGVSGSNWCFGEYYNVGTNGTCDGLTHGDGVFYRSDWNRPFQLTSIQDGTSQTLLVGEDLPALNTHCSWPYANNAVGTTAIPPNLGIGSRSYSPRDWIHLYSFRSRHPYGLQFAFADGSVHFVSDTIRRSVYRALSTVSGGETVDGEY
jgi:hypothetical protein